MSVCINFLCLLISFTYVLYCFSQPRGYPTALYPIKLANPFPLTPSRRYPQNPPLFVLRNDIWLPDSGQQEVFLSKEYKHGNFRFCFSSKVSKALEMLFFSSPLRSSLDNFENTKIKHFPDVKCVEMIILLMISLQSQTNFSWAAECAETRQPELLIYSDPLDGSLPGKGSKHYVFLLANVLKNIRRMTSHVTHVTIYPLINITMLSGLRDYIL